jgi:hypothetical protein
MPKCGMVVEEWLAEDFPLKMIKVQTSPNLQVVLAEAG